MNAQYLVRGNKRPLLPVGLLTDPPLRSRVLWRAELGPETLLAGDRALIASTFGTLYLAGGLIGAVIVMIGDSAGRNDLALFGICAIAIALGLVCLIGYRRLPGWFFQANITLGTLLVTAAMVFGSRGAEGVYALFYVWVIFFAAFFFPVRVAALQGALVAVCFGTVLYVEDSPFAANLFLTALATLATTGLILSLLRTRMESLARSLSADAHTDQLTCIANRRSFDERLALELGRVRRQGRGGIGLIICDLDRFKTINDAFGHEGGDAALQKAALTLTGAVRSVDLVARIGGEEFGVILPGADEKRAGEVAERIRLDLRRAFASDDPGLTVSCGVSAIEGDEIDGDALFHTADMALYAAKRGGRNATAVYSGDTAQLIGGKRRSRLRRPF